MEIKHTNGEWQACGSDHSKRVIVKRGQKLICVVTPNENDWNNAKLIATAPKLYKWAMERLQVMEKVYESGYLDPKCIEEFNELRKIKQATE